LEGIGETKEVVAVINPEMAAALVKAKGQELMRDASRGRAAGGGRHGRPRWRRGAWGSERAQLVARSRELVRLAASSGFACDDLVQMIEGLW
jgi:hypothetical protein